MKKHIIIILLIICNSSVINAQSPEFFQRCVGTLKVNLAKEQVIFENTNDVSMECFIYLNPDVKEETGGIFDSIKNQYNKFDTGGYEGLIFLDRFEKKNIGLNKFVHTEYKSKLDNIYQIKKIYLKCRERYVKEPGSANRMINF